MGKIDLEKGVKQGEDFKLKYGEYPHMPIRVSYRFMSTNAEGELQPTRFGGYSIFGYPGIVGAGDDEVHDVKFLYDGAGRLFPDITEKDCVTIPCERKGEL